MEPPNEIASSEVGERSTRLGGGEKLHRQRLLPREHILFCEKHSLKRGNFEEREFFVPWVATPRTEPNRAVKAFYHNSALELSTLAS